MSRANEGPERGGAGTGEDVSNDLIAAARRGDDAAWAELYAELAGPLLGYFRTQGASDPEDLVGEVFLQVVRGLAGFVGELPELRAWVFTIAHHRMIDDRRARQRRRVDATDVAEIEAALPPDVLEPEVLRALDTEAVIALLQLLTDDQREVLVLRLVGGLTTAEVGTVTDRDPEAVKGLAKRGLARLRRLVEQPDLHPPPNSRSGR